MLGHSLGAHNHIPLDVEPDQNLGCALVLLSAVSFLGFSSKKGSSGLTRGLLGDPKGYQY